jgi:hypothetical protein
MTRSGLLHRPSWAVSVQHWTNKWQQAFTRLGVDIHFICRGGVNNTPINDAVWVIYASARFSRIAAATDSTQLTLGDPDGQRAQSGADNCGILSLLKFLQIGEIAVSSSRLVSGSCERRA